MMAAPALIPAKPLGANPPSLGSVQCAGLISVEPTAQKNTMMPILSSTMALFELADSRMPITRIQVMRATMRKAGRLAITGKPNRWGAVVKADARYWVGASVAPCAIASAARWADRMSVESQGGIEIPK